MLTNSKNIRKLRERRDVSQEQLFKPTDISLKTVVKLELDETKNLTIETLQKIAKALDIKVENLIK